jgi:predicted nucleic acid-binding protein
VNVIVDTCVWSKFFLRGNPERDSVAAELKRIIALDAVLMVGAIRQELLSGVGLQPRFEQLREYLRFFPNVQQDEEDDERAAEYYNICRRHGIQGGNTDFLICALAVRHGLKVFSTDNDFDAYARYVPVKLHKPRI